MECMASTLKQTSKEVLLDAPALDPHLQKITELTEIGCSASIRRQLR